MLRAVYEGIVFSHYTHVQKLLVNREKPKSIRLSGGAANSDVWVQIFADVLQIPIDVIEDKELGAQGAAMAAGIAAGIYPDYKTAIERTVKISKTIYPVSYTHLDVYKRQALYHYTTYDSYLCNIGNPDSYERPACIRYGMGNDTGRTGRSVRCIDVLCIF